MAEGVTTVAIPIAHGVVTATFEPSLDPEQERSVSEATRVAREVSEAVRILMLFAEQYRRTLAVETTLSCAVAAAPQKTAEKPGV
jgi:hypothetical protein